MLGAACAAIVVGALAQRLTGMGFALIAAPFIVILMGPQAGVILVNIMGVVSSTVILLRVRRYVEWRTYLWLAAPAIVGVVPGALLAARLDTAALEIGIGLLLVAALLITVSARRIRVTATGPAPAIAAGFVSGATNAAAGIGGPPLSVYAVMTRWEQRAFAATLQPYFVTIGLCSVLAKVAWSPERWPDFHWGAWLAMIAALLLGTSLGDRLAARVPAGWARAGMLTLAMLGSISVAAHGFSLLAA